MNPIREIRQRTGMTQEAFAKRMGICRTTFLRMERREKPQQFLVDAARWTEHEINRERA